MVSTYNSVFSPPPLLDGGHGLVAKLCPTIVTPWTIACQALPSMGPGKNTGVGCHFLLQGIFLTHESNPGILHCRQIPYQLSYKGSPCRILSAKKLPRTRSKNKTQRPWSHWLSVSDPEFSVRSPIGWFHSGARGSTQHHVSAPLSCWWAGTWGQDSRSKLSRWISACILATGNYQRWRLLLHSLSTCSAINKLGAPGSVI